MMKYGTSSNIPKILHFCWIQGKSHIPKDRSGNIDKWKDLNRSYKIEFWDEERILSEFPEPFLSEYLKVDTPVKRSDFARCWILANYGGWYIDIDLVPRRSLEKWMDDEFVFGRLERGQYEPVNYRKYSFIFTREYRKIDKLGHAVANGIVGTIADTIWSDFLRSRFEFRDEKTLTSFGPHALTRFLRPVIKELNAIVIPPSYFLWERLHFGEPAPFCISEHPGENTWGDPSKQKWWET